MKVFQYNLVTGDHCYIEFEHAKNKIVSKYSSSLERMIKVKNGDFQNMNNTSSTEPVQFVIIGEQSSESSINLLQENNSEQASATEQDTTTNCDTKQRETVEVTNTIGSSQDTKNMILDEYGYYRPQPFVYDETLKRFELKLNTYKNATKEATIARGGQTRCRAEGRITDPKKLKDVRNTRRKGNLI